MGTGRWKRHISSQKTGIMRCSDEVYLGFYGPHAKLRVIHKPGDRYCSDCFLGDKGQNEKDKKNTITVGLQWATTSSLKYTYFYEVPGNINRKMSQRFCIDQISPSKL